MKKTISLTALVFLFVCFMTGCAMVRSGEKAVKQGAQQVQDRGTVLLS